MPASSGDKSITVANKDADAISVANKTTTKGDTQVDTKVDTKVETKIDAKIETKVDTKVTNKAVTKVASKVADKVADSARTSVADSDHRSSSPLSTSPSTSPEKGQELDLDQPQLEDQELMQVVLEDTVPKEIAPTASGPVAFDPVGNTSNTPVLSNGVVENNGIEVENGLVNSNLQAPPVFRVPGAADSVPIIRSRATKNVNMNYDNTNLDDITMRQLGEDVDAYEHDLNWCRTQLSGDDLTPQESRTLQLRTLDLTHQIRHCKHKIETMQFQSRKPLPGSALPRLGAFNNPYRTITNVPNGGDKRRRSSRDEVNNLDGTNEISQTLNENGLKRPASVDMSPASPSGSVAQSNKRAKVHISLDPVEFDDSTNMEDIKGPIMAMQRLGFWKCQLCLTPTYLLAGNGRSPAQPCKWPLKDISKMIAHFTSMHGEQESEARLSELGRALDLNRKYLHISPVVIF